MTDQGSILPWALFAFHKALDYFPITQSSCQNFWLLFFTYLIDVTVTNLLLTFCWSFYAFNNHQLFLFFVVSYFFIMVNYDNPKTNCPSTNDFLSFFFLSFFLSCFYSFFFSFFLSFLSFFSFFLSFFPSLFLSFFLLMVNVYECYRAPF